MRYMTYKREKKTNLLRLVIKRFLRVQYITICTVYYAGRECYKRAASGSDFTTVTVNGFYDSFLCLFILFCVRACVCVCKVCFFCVFIKCYKIFHRVDARRPRRRAERLRPVMIIEVRVCRGQTATPHII